MCLEVAAFVLLTATADVNRLIGSGGLEGPIILTVTLRNYLAALLSLHSRLVH